MIGTLHILNFKKVKSLTLPKLNRVNLLVGDNNVGKSTILEALSLYLSNGSESQIWKLLSNRGEAISPLDENIADYNREHYLSLFHNREENYSKQFGISIGESMISDQCLRISQIYYSESRTSDNTPIIHLFSQEDVEEKHFNITGTGIRVSSKSKTFHISYQSNTPSFRQIAKLAPFEYVRSSDFTPTENASRYDAITLTDVEPYVAEALRFIHPDIDRISFVNDSPRWRIPMASFKDSKKRIRLSSMGDGINRMLTVILALLNCKGGVFMIDEFETGLYYTVQTKLWEIVFMLAEKLNIQVFATTHSSDCIRSFAKANNGQGTLIRMEEHEGELTTTSYSDSELIFATNNQIELR